jgi:adenosylhomocysteine nucleosidase
LLAGVTVHDAAAGKFRLGTLQGRSVATVVSGPGRAAAARATEALLIGHRPRLVVSAGFCGALRPELKRLDIVVADRIVGQGGATHVVDPATLGRFRFADAHVGPFVEVERIIARSADKRALAERTGGAACEMESLAVAEVCVARQTPFLAVRVVSDVFDEDLPGDLESLLTASSGMQTFGAVVGTLWRRPASIKDLLRLKETALTASDRLAKFLAELVRQLPADCSATASRLTENPEP